MPTLTKHAKKFFDKVKHRPTQVSAYIPIEENHVENGKDLGTNFESGQHYFRAVVSEMFLADSRAWFREYDPIVYSAVEFNYDRSQQEEPKVIGPELLGNNASTPLGTLFLNTPVTGLHPFVGGDFTFTLILYRAQKSNHLSNLLTMVEKVVSVANPSIAMANYLGVANVIMDGLELILGTHQTDPIIAVRDTVTLSMNGGFKPGYYALINAPEEKVDRKMLWVKSSRLCIGDTLRASEPYRNHDFILFRIIQYTERDDIRTLPFFPLWEETQKLAVDPTTWDDAKSSFNTLYRELLLSSDLTDTQREKLQLEFKDSLVEYRRKALDRQQMGATRGETNNIKTEFQKQLNDLQMLFKNLD